MQLLPSEFTESMHPCSVNHLYNFACILVSSLALMPISVPKMTVATLLGFALSRWGSQRNILHCDKEGYKKEKDWDGLLEFRGTSSLAIDRKENLSIILTDLVSAACWAGFTFSSTRFMSAPVGVIFLLAAIISLLRFGQLLDRQLKGVI